MVPVEHSIRTAGGRMPDGFCTTTRTPSLTEAPDFRSSSMPCGDGCRAGSGQHDRGRRRGRLTGGGFGTGLGRRLPGPHLRPSVLTGPCLGGHGLVQLPLGRRTAIVDRLPFNASLIETGTESYRLARTRAN
jgi:hypothetical protein